jgi:hypothetical protein
VYGDIKETQYDGIISKIAMEPIYILYKAKSTPTASINYSYLRFWDRKMKGVYR